MDHAKIGIATGAAAGIGRSGPPGQRREPEVLPRHVIDEYTHKSQVVRCECGWTGSSASPDGRPSAWKRHVAESKGPKG
jgi:hypothetical protein